MSPLRFLLLVLAPLMLAAMSAAPGLRGGDDGIGARALDGTTFALESGEQVRLAGLVPLFAGEPFHDEARAGLGAMIAGADLRLRYDRERRDRRDRAIAHVFIEGAGEPVWLQSEMLRAGLARVSTTERNQALAAEMLAAEAEARDAGRGLWAAPDYAVRTPDPHALAQLLDTFQIVEGIVVDAAETRDFLYLNFGLDYRTDFTVSIRNGDIDDVRDGGLDPLDLEGARIRVRGWVHAINGPMIDVDHAAQIEVLD